jgi:hypothetical protein
MFCIIGDIIFHIILNFCLYRLSPNQEKTGNSTVMIIGNHNVFEVDCCTEALKIGDQNVLESKCTFSGFLTRKLCNNIKISMQVSSAAK